jgi:hypothetical protein
LEEREREAGGYMSRPITDRVIERYARTRGIWGTMHPPDPAPEFEEPEPPPAESLTNDPNYNYDERITETPDKDPIASYFEKMDEAGEGVRGVYETGIYMSQDVVAIPVGASWRFNIEFFIEAPPDVQETTQEKWIHGDELDIYMRDTSRNPTHLQLHNGILFALEEAVLEAEMESELHKTFGDKWTSENNHLNYEMVQSLAAPNMTFYLSRFVAKMKRVLPNRLEARGLTIKDMGVSDLKHRFKLMVNATKFQTTNMINPELGVYR